MDGHMARRAARVRILGAGAVLALALSGCAQQPATGTPAAGGTAGTGAGFTWPFAGLRNPFGGAPVDPDLRGRMGGPLDTSGAAGSGGGMARPGAAPAAGGGGVSDPFAGQGVRKPDIAGPGGAPAASGGGATAGGAATPGTASGGGTAQTHTVAAGETAWSISRRYGVSVAELAAANGLPESMAIRTGQKLAIPVAASGQAGRVTVTAPGVGSPTPQPPSAAKPLPSEQTVPAAAPVARPAAPDLGATRTAASGSGRFSMPVQGSIIRAYEKGKNEGIDISAAPGTPVKAAGAGTVAAITRDTDGVPIVVIRHDGTLMTVYAGLDGLKVAKGDSVSAGQTLGAATSAGVVHFEVRRGFESVDPVGLLG